MFCRDRTASDELSPVRSRTSCRYGRMTSSTFIDSRNAEAKPITSGVSRKRLPFFPT